MSLEATPRQARAPQATVTRPLVRRRSHRVKERALSRYQPAVVSLQPSSGVARHLQTRERRAVLLIAPTGEIRSEKVCGAAVAGCYGVAVRGALPRVRRLKSQARAACQSRMEVARDVSRTSPTSSSDSPPKNRSSATRAL